MYYTIQDAFDDLQQVSDETLFYILNSYGEKLFPVSAHSYRGSYDDVAFSTAPRTGTVGEFRDFLTDIIGETYWSRGGDQRTMTEKSFIYIADPGMLGEAPVDIKLAFNDNEASDYYVMQTEEE